MRSSLFVTAGRAVPQLRKLYAKLVVYNENIVVAKKIHLPEGAELQLLRDDDRQLEQMMSLKHRNVATFFGLWHDTDSEVDNDWYFLQEYGVRGSLQDILGRVQITWQVKKSFMRDISCGMQYMKGSTLLFNCLF